MWYEKYDEKFRDFVKSEKLANMAILHSTGCFVIFKGYMTSINSNVLPESEGKQNFSVRNLYKIFWELIVTPKLWNSCTSEYFHWFKCMLEVYFNFQYTGIQVKFAMQETSK